MLTQDSKTRTVVFYSSCDPLGTNPFGGQLFAMRPDGSDLRQLTHTRGVVTTPAVDGDRRVTRPVRLRAVCALTRTRWSQSSNRTLHPIALCPLTAAA